MASDDPKFLVLKFEGNVADPELGIDLHHSPQTVLA
jgi:hypothetical protein